jgi:hypothetical protein
MSRDLPTTPNLEHLRKQAKRRLSEMQLENPALQLSDAQHVIAREYGFASWPKLKAHVESLPMPTSDPTSGASPFVGTWMANVARSRQHPLNPFRSATMHFDVDGDTVTISDTVIDGSGRLERTEHTVRADGQERFSDGGYSITATWRGPRVLETIGRKDGEEIGRGRYEVADDGATMTISSAEQTIVLNRI